jgi:hypothetical protein
MGMVKDVCDLRGEHRREKFRRRESEVGNSSVPTITTLMLRCPAKQGRKP